MNSREHGIALIILGAIVLAASYSLSSDFMARGTELHKTCPLDPSICPFTVPPWQGIILFISALAMISLGILTYRSKTQTTETGIDMGSARKKMETVDGEEKDVYRIVLEGNGMAFQGDIMKKTSLSKVKVSRILDRLESKGLVERRRRGMSNIVVIK